MGDGSFSDYLQANEFIMQMHNHMFGTRNLLISLACHIVQFVFPCRLLLIINNI